MGGPERVAKLQAFLGRRRVAVDEARRAAALGGKHLVEEDAEVGRDVVVGPRLALRDAADVA